MFQVKRNGKITLLGLALAILMATAVAAVPGIFSSVNSTSGYKVNSTAGSSGEALCSDGTFFDTPCSLFNQTLEENSTPLTQRPTLNLISGANATVSCIDNGGSNRTDCTLSSAAGPARTCNVNGCYIQYADGTIHAWGISSLVTGTPNSTVLTITYPVTFTSTPSPVVAPVAAPAGGGGPCTGFSCPVTCNAVRTSLSTTGANVGMSWATVNASGFSNLSAGDYCSWTADGN